MTTDKTEYKVGDELDLSSLVLTVEYDNNTSEVINVTMDMVSGFDSSKPGTLEVTVTYKGKTATFTVKIVAEEPEVKVMTVEPATGATIKEGQTILVTAEGADDLRIMLWAKAIGSVEEARLAYDEKVFSSRTTDLIAGGMDIVEDNGVFTITINETLIDILEKGIQYADGGVPSEGNYTWLAGNATTWLITPVDVDEDGKNIPWEEYATWDGEKVNESIFVYNLGTAEPEPEAAVEPTTGVSPSTDEPVEGVQAFTFGFKSVTGNLQEMELDIYLGENTGENRDYANHLGINLPAGSDAVASWVEQVVAGYGELDSKFHGLLAAAGYVVDAGDEANKQALKENIFYTAGDDGTGTWTIKLDTAVLGEEAIEFLVAVRDDQGAQWGNNNYVAYPDDVKAFLYNVTLPEPAITMTAGEPTIEDGKVTLAVTTKNTGADYENARYGIKVNAAGVEGDTISVSYGDEGLTFNLTRVEGSDDFIGYFGPADGFTITKGWDVTTTFTVDFGTAASDRTVKVDAWVNQGAEPAEEDAVAKMEQLEITIPAAEPEEYHTYKFKIEDKADEYIVSDGLVDPTDADFAGMTPVKLSIVVDSEKDKAYGGNVRVAPVNADGLQLWAKDTAGKWHDINQVGWGPSEGFPIDTTLVTDVYVIATAAFDGTVTLELVDVTGDYGAVDNIIISQEVEVKVVVSEEEVLADIDKRILEAIDKLDFEGTGIGNITYADKHAVFTIGDLNTDIVEFADSGVIEIFQEMFTDVSKAVISIEGKEPRTIENPAGMTEGELKLAIADNLIYPLIEGADTRNLIELVGKSASAEITIKLGEVEYTATYSVEFVAGDDTVFDDIDARIEEAIDKLDFEGTGIRNITYADKHAVFTIGDLNTDIVEFADSGVIEIFQEMFKDVSQAVIKIDGEVVGTIENPAGMTEGQLKLAIAENLIYPLIEGADTRNLIELVGKSASAEITIKLGEVEYTATYSVEFVAGDDTVFDDIDARIEEAIDKLDFEGTGIRNITYADKHAVFTIGDLNTDIVEFADSGVIEIFQEMFTDVSKAVIKIDGEVVGTIENPAGMTEGELKLAIADNLIYPLIEGADTRNLIELVGKSASAEITIKLGEVEYTATYSVEFVAGDDTVFDDIDARIEESIEQLNLEGTGISNIDYANRHATFTIDGLNTDIVEFADSGVIEIFQEMFKDVSQAVIKIDGEVVGTIENPAGMTEGQLKLAIAENLIYPLIEGADTRNLIELVGKSASAEITIKLGEVEYTATYSVEFVAGDDTVFDDIDARIEESIEQLNLEGTGISNIDYANRHATFTIDGLNTDIVEFANSGVIEIFQEMFKDVSQAVIKIDGEEVGTIENPAGMTEGQLKLAIAESLIYPLIEGADTRNLIELVGKGASAELTIKLGEKTYTATYSVEFVAGEGTVFDDIDARIDKAIKELNLDGTGIGNITYADKHAIFTISDLNKDIVEFADSGVLNLFLEMFKDVKTAKINDGEVIDLEGMTEGQLKLAIAENLIYPLIEGADTRNLIELVGKTASAEMTIVLGDKTYTATYSVEFVASDDTVLSDIDARIDKAIKELSLEGTGISNIAYADKHATFTISDLNTDIVEFAGSGVIDVFQEMFKDVTKAVISIEGQEPRTIDNLAGMTPGNLKLAIAENLIYPLIGEDAATRNLIELVGKTASAEMTIVLGDKTYTATYSVEFDGDQAMADKVIAQINALPAPEEITLENRAAVKAARLAFSVLTDDQKALIGEDSIQRLELAETKIDAIINAEITTVIEHKIKPAFIGFADTINNQAPKSVPPYRLWVEYDIDELEVTFLFSEEAKGMDPIAGTKGTGLKTAFYRLVDVPEIQGASAGGKTVDFKDEDGNPKSGGSFELELMIFGAYLIGGMPDTVGEVIDTHQIMDLDCKMASGIAFPMKITFFFKEAIEYASIEDKDFDITVAFGTTKEDALAELIDTVRIIGTDNETADTTIKWTIADYDSNEAGEYTATGKFTLPIGWVGHSEDVSAKVTVAAPIHNLTLTGEGLTSEPEAGGIKEGTEVTITVAAPEGKHVATFTVNGEDKTDELVDGKYTFTITADTSIVVTYEETLVPNTIEIKGSDSIEIKLSGEVTETYTATVKDQYGNEMSEESVTWALKEAVAGVSVDTNTGKVTVADTTTAGSFTIVATSTANANVKAERTVTFTKEKNNDATLKALMVNGETVEGFTDETLEYNVELPAGTTEVPTVTATATDSNVTVDITQATGLDGTNNVATVTVTAEDGSTTKTYTITFTVAPNGDQDAPTGLEGVAPTTEDNNDGRITGVNDTMEYKLSTNGEWTLVPNGATEITGLAAGTYEVRYAAKGGYNAGEAAEVEVPEYEAPIVEAEIETVIAENGKVTITLAAKPTEAPVEGDFNATIAIDGGEATGLILSGFAIDEDGVTVTFNFEAVKQTEIEQSVVVAVKLGEGEPVAADAFGVAADPLADEKAAVALISGKSVEVDFGKGEDAAAVLAAIKALGTENTKIQALTEDAISIADGKATVTFADGVAAEVTVTEAADSIEAAKQAFLDAVTAYNPKSDIYEYSFDGKILDIKFDFSECTDDAAAIFGVVEAAGEFLTAIFDIGEAQQIVINMNGQEVEIDSNSSQNEIIELAGAVFDVDAKNGGAGALFVPVSNFLGVGTEFTPTVKADFTMTVTNQDAIVFTLDGLTATFANVTQMD